MAPGDAGSSRKISEHGIGGGPRSAPGLPLPTELSDVSSLLGSKVQYRGVMLATVRDVFLAPDEERVLGLEVEAAGDKRFFLPFGTWASSSGTVEVARPLAVLSEVELRFYECGARRLTGRAAART